METWKTLYQAYGTHKWRIALLVVLGLVSSLLESFGIAALIPLFSLLVGTSAPGTDFASKLVLRLFDYLPLSYGLESVLAVIVFFFLVRAVFTLAFHYTRTKFVVDYRSMIMKDMLSSVLNSSWPFLLQQKLGHLQATFLRSVQQGVLLLTSLTQAIGAATAFFVYLIAALAIDHEITLYTVGVGAVLVVILRPLASRARTAANRMKDVERETTQHLSEHVIGMKTVKALGAKEQVLRRGNVLIEEFGKENMKAGILRSLGIDFVQPLSLLFIATIFAIFYKESGFNLGVFIATIYLVQKIFVNIESLQRISHSLAEFVPYTADIVELRKQLVENREEDAGGKPFVFKEKLEFHNVGLTYQSDKEVLKNVSFKLEKGKSIGLIGPSGSGKTSIADLILRLFEPNRGNITLDGTGIKDINMGHWRKRVGYVAQEPFLLNDTIKANIRFYDKSISEKDILDAANQAYVYGFVTSDLETQVGERGAMLSVGQRQRIALARVLARKPDILILDEATSALDNASQDFIKQTISDLKGKVSVFIIAHRLSTIKDVDWLLVLEGGEIKEQGNPEDLKRNSESLFSMVSKYELL